MSTGMVEDGMVEETVTYGVSPRPENILNTDDWFCQPLCAVRDRAQNFS
jgi:hypothetical protein